MIHRFSERESDVHEERHPPTIVGMLFHRRVPILVGLGILLVAAITLVLVLPRQFQSHMDILVRNKLPLSARINATTQETVDEERMQSEVTLLHSPELAARVVDPDYPTQPDSTHTAADLKRHQASLALFSHQLVTTVAPNSNLIHVIVTAEDPHRAGELASRLLDVFFASQSEVAHPTAPTSFFIAESNQARSAWQEAQLALDGFLLAHPPTPTGSAAEISLQIAALKHQIQRNDEQIDATIGRILTGERKLITIPAHPLDANNKSRNRSSAMPLLSVAQLNAMLAIYNDEQAILLTRPPTDAEAVRASLSLASQIADTNATKRLAEQSGSPERDPGANSLWQATTDDIAKAGVELKTLYATRNGLANQLASFQGQLNQVLRPTTLLAGLQLRAAATQNSFRLADQRANEARIADAMDQQLRLNVAVASRPSFSNRATSPSPWLYAAAIALAVIFLAACLTLFAGMYSNEYETDEYDDEYGESDSSEERHNHVFVPESHEDLQQQIPFPSRIRTSQSGAFLYAAPGGSVPAPRPAAEHDTQTDPAFEPIPNAPHLSDILAHPEDPIDAPAPQPEEHAVEPEPFPSPAAEILHPHQYEAAAPQAEAPRAPSTAADFAAEPPLPRHNSGETHAAVPSFFAAPPLASITMEPEIEDYLDEPTVPAAPFAGAPEVPAPHLEPPVIDEDPAPIFSAIPTPDPEPVVTLPDPTPPWSQPAPEPRPATVPPLSYWASVYEADATSAEPTQPEAPAPADPTAQNSQPAAEEPTQPPASTELTAHSSKLAADPQTQPASEPPVPAELTAQSSPLVADPQPEPASAAPASAELTAHSSKLIADPQTEPASKAPVTEPAVTYPEPIYVAPVRSEVPAPPQPVAAAPAVVPSAIPQAFTSTLRPAPFLTSHTSTLSPAAFRFTPVPADKTPAPAPRPTPPPIVPPAPPPVRQVAVPSVPIPPPTPRPTPPPAEPAAFTPDPELVLTYASSEPIELVPDPILPPVKPPYQVARPQPAAAPAPPEPVAALAPEPVLPPEVSEFPIFRPQKPAPAQTEAPAQPKSYEEMVRSLTYPEATAPYVPPTHPAPPPVRRPEPLPVPVAAPEDDEAPPFFYARKSVPETPAPPAPLRDDYEALQSFIRRPSVPLQPAPPAREEYDDRTTYHQAYTPPAPAPTPAPPDRDTRDDYYDRDDRTTYHQAVPQPPARASWIDIAPAPPPRAETLDPQKRAPDRISAIRDSGASRINSAFDESGRRLTPSQRMKRGRPVPSYDKDGKVSYESYLNNNDQDKTRY